MENRLKLEEGKIYFKTWKKHKFMQIYGFKIIQTYRMDSGHWLRQSYMLQKSPKWRWSAYGATLGPQSYTWLYNLRGTTRQK